MYSYFAPELFNSQIIATAGSSSMIVGKQDKKNTDQKSDMWSVGVILYTLFSGKVPFSGSSEDEYLRSVKTGTIEFGEPIWSQVSEDLKSFIVKLLQLDPRKRPSAKDALSEKWFSNVPQK